LGSTLIDKEVWPIINRNMLFGILTVPFDRELNCKTLCRCSRGILTTSLLLSVFYGDLCSNAHIKTVIFLNILPDKKNSPVADCLKTGDRLYVGNLLHIGVKRLYLLATLAASGGQKMLDREK
jgi:hypothetical protein